LVFIGSLCGGHVVGNFPPHEAFAIGGTNSVRGYEEGAVGSGRSYAVGSGEISFPMVSGTFFSFSFFFLCVFVFGFLGLGGFFQVSCDLHIGDWCVMCKKNGESADYFTYNNTLSVYAKRKL
jgi:hypothetical protein